MSIVHDAKSSGDKGEKVAVRIKSEPKLTP